jgi:hypothetical protein
MNCLQTREHLPELLYGGLAPEIATAVKTHLAGCGECRRELDALKQVRNALDAVPPVTAEVDLPGLYRAVAQTHERRSRRWRRMTFALGGLAAALVLLAILPSLEMRCEGHQFVVRWGTPPAPQPQPPPQPNAPEPEREHIQFVSTTAPDVDEQLRLLSDLVQRLDDGDKRHRQDVAALRIQVNDLREQLRQWRVSMERDVAALYAIHFPETKKGKPQ